MFYDSGFISANHGVHRFVSLNYQNTKSEQLRGLRARRDRGSANSAELEKGQEKPVVKPFPRHLSF